MTIIIPKNNTNSVGYNDLYIKYAIGTKYMLANIFLKNASVAVT